MGQAGRRRGRRRLLAGAICGVLICQRVADCLKFSGGRTKESLAEIVIKQRNQLKSHSLAESGSVLCKEVRMAWHQAERIIRSVLHEHVCQAVEGVERRAKPLVRYNRTVRRNGNKGE